MSYIGARVRKTQWSEDVSQLSEKLKISQTLLVNILMVYFLCSN